MRIKSLSSSVANQIAAGEVIENPASVVKELLENAYDAGATTIAIEIGFGGLNKIKISDNGCGIDSEDLPLAIAPHATSKLTQLSDLATLTSMGFRGEALASIASVSRVIISSKPPNQENAMMLRADGEIVELSPCARNQGTTIDVCDLFYNAPVRRRFLKSERSEYLSIEHIVKRFALSAPEIAIVLKHNDKVTLELPAATHEQSLRLRVQRILGKAFMDNAFHIDVERAGMHLNGWISGYEYQRSQNDKQWIYLNRRMVRDKLIQHAFKQAYENRLYPGRHPACLLYLSISTESVDVNVHPTKHEVRFQEPRLVHDFIRSQVIDVLTTQMPPDAIFEPIAREFIDENRLQLNNNNYVESEAMQVIDAPILKMAISQPQYQNSLKAQENYIPCPQPATVKISSQHSTKWKILNQQFGLLTWNDESYLFHIQKAQEQFYFWSIQQSTLPLPHRPLLVPISIEHQDTNDKLLQLTLSACQTYGIQVDLNNTHVIVRTIPISMPQLDIKELMVQVLKLLPTNAEMPSILAQHQLTDAIQIPPYEKEALADYIIQQLIQKPTPPPWCVCLNVERCLELLHG